MNLTYRLFTAAAVLMACAQSSWALTEVGNNFDGDMSLIYNDVNGGVFVENSPHPNPSVQGLSIASASGLLIPANLNVPPANIVSASPNLIELNDGAGNWLGTASFLGAILPPSVPQLPMLSDLTIMYNQFSMGTVAGDLIHGSFGQLQAQPVLPPQPGGQCCRFFNVATGQFFDPPMASGYEYEIMGAGLFTKVGLPLGLGNNFTISSSEGTVTGLTENSEHVFTNGVSRFVLTGITPPVDPDDHDAFPLYLEFSTPTASFEMTPVPEPGTMVLVGLTLFGAAGLVGRRR